jgi:hypothetical protein
VWQTLCAAYFNKLVQPQFRVLELGAGYGHFINNVPGARKTGVHQWAGFIEYQSQEFRVMQAAL